MLTEHEIFQIPTINKKDFRIEVNYKPDDPATNECKILKLKFPDGSTDYVKREHLYSFLFAIGRPEDQRKIVPQKLTKVRWYETVLGVKATKDIRKGEMMNFPIKISIPSVEEEVIGEIRKSKLKI